jgi:hypothetical protein
VPPVGDRHVFKVCSTLNCSPLVNVVARAQAVVGHVAIYVDSLAPPGGLSPTDIDTLAQLFETHIYEVDTTNFGRESDIDNNGVVIALMTPRVNQLVAAPCTNGYVAGFFLSADVDPRVDRGTGVPIETEYNNGEVIYSIVADPTGSTGSCPHSVASVKALVPSTFLHELQHLINFTQHLRVLGGSPEQVWLDEALSKYAEELGGRSFLPGTASDTATFKNYVSGDLYDGYQYLQATGSHPMVTNTDQSLSDVGGGWLFMRYLADQFGASISRHLVQTRDTGTINIAARTGQAFDLTASHWALAVWVSDLQVTGFTAPPELKYNSWQFRSTYASLNAQDPNHFPQAFPLVPVVSAGSQVGLSGMLHAGSGVYLRAVQGPGGAQFSLLFSGPGSVALPAHIVPRLDIIRIR